MSASDQKAFHKDYSDFIKGVELDSLHAERSSFEVRGAMPSAPMLIRLQDTPELRDIKSSRLVVEHKYRLEIREKGKRKLFVVIQAVFIAAYHIGQQPSDEVLNAFLERNVRLNTWPFFRELAYSSLTRMNLPPLVLPVLKR